MGMSRNDYQAIADAIAPNVCAFNDEIVQGIAATARDIADVMAANNPLFSRELFLLACGLDKDGLQRGG